MKISHHLQRASVIAALLLPQAAFSQQTPAFDTGMIPSTHILLPDGDLNASVFLISGAAGWGEAEETQAKALVEKGAAVVGIDFPAYIKALSADDDDCVYMISDIESLAQQIQRSVGNSNYHLPIVAGIGEGGALALAMISQSPVSTIGGAVAVDPLAGIPLKKELCTPVSKTPSNGRTIYGFLDGELPAPVTVLFSSAADKAGRDHVTALDKIHDDMDVQDVSVSASEALTQTLSDHIDAAGDNSDPLGLPLSVLETKPTMNTMAIIYSGDGGWRDLDKEVGGVLQSKGIPVIGVDSLRYFWSERKPQETADDLARIIETYRHQWKIKHVLLIGYSFGADLLPATYNLLPDDDKARVAQISLLALSREVDYEVSVTGWLGVAGGGDSGDSIKDIAKIDPKLIQCVYGTDEDDDPCPTLKDKGVETIAIDGGHHFDEDYEALAERIITGLKTRLQN
jgi:type IV secretory pathway VirJ component